MTKPMLLTATIAALAAIVPAAPAPAQIGERTLVIYGNDKCPTSNGEEIVVCVRRSENERYRIPPELRPSDPLYNRTWADRSQSLEYVGASGPQSCSPVGPGGASGCFREIVRQARAEQRAKGEEPAIPLALP